MNLTGVFESHSHYDDSAFDADRHQLLTQLRKDGISGILGAASDMKSSFFIAELSRKYEYFWCSAGVHPEEVGAVQEEDLLRLEKLLDNPKCVAVGEIGLDYHYMDVPKEKQRDWFERQLQLAVRRGKPVIVHSREATADSLELLKKYKPRGVVHCFSSSVEVAREITKIGMYIGFTGIVTFKNAHRAKEVAAQVPLQSVLIETDCPYMAPEPFRGKRCDSSMLPYIAEQIAQLKQIPVFEVIDATRKNAEDLFQIAT